MANLKLWVFNTAGMLEHPSSDDSDVVTVAGIVLCETSAEALEHGRNSYMEQYGEKPDYMSAKLVPDHVIEEAFNNLRSRSHG